MNERGFILHMKKEGRETWGGDGGRNGGMRERNVGSERGSP